MGQLQQLLTSLSLRQRITILLSVALAGAALFGLTRWKRESDFRPLYTAMAAEDAGTVIQKLKESGVEYRLSESGGTVLVPSAKIAETRLALASAGLPKSGRIGFELFDKTNFGATEFVEHINYNRALEGELERSVMSMADVEQARVHITFPKDSVFLESKAPAKASVLVRLRGGAQLSPQSVMAVTHLVASAVEGLAPEAVSVLDMRGNLLNRPRRLTSSLGDTGAADEMLETRQGFEKDLVAKINSTLEPLLGAEKFRAGASVECDFTSSEESEESYDPNKSVMLTSQVTEDASTAKTAAGGVPGTASNLPRPAARPAAAPSGVSRRTENITYQSSRLVRQRRFPQGTVKKMSLAVLVDHNVTWQGVGEKKQRVLAPPPPETMKAIHDLVAAATGLSSERGDQLIVESLPFESTLNFEPLAPARPVTPASPQTQLLDLWNKNKYLVIGAGGAVLLLLLLMVFFMIRRKKRAGLGGMVSGPSLALPSAETEEDEEEPETAGAGQRERAARKRRALAAGPQSQGQVAVAIREVVTKDAKAPAAVLRGWLSEV